MARACIRDDVTRLDRYDSVVSPSEAHEQAIIMALYTTWLILAGFLVERPPANTALTQELTAAIEATFAHKDLQGLTVGLAVGCADGRSPVVGHNPNKPMNPASGTKLLTSAAALAAFEPTHRFKTAFFGDAGPEGVVAGDLVIQPAGDPSVQRKAISELAKAIAKAGVRRVVGDVVVDVSDFGPEDLPPAYGQKNTDAAYRPAVPAFGIEDGVLRVTVTPSKVVGEATTISVSPSSRTTIVENASVTVDGKGIRELDVGTAAGPRGATRVIISGKLGQKAPRQAVWRRMTDPAAFAVEALEAALKKAGVKVEGNVRLTKEPLKARGPELGAITGATLAELIAEINIHSNNYWAEALFRILGIENDSGRRTWSGAAAFVTESLTTRYGLKPYDFLIVNGSGLYDATRIAPAAMVELLKHFAGDSGKASALRASLAKAGASGTLRRRLKELKGRLVGKTGTLDNAVSLSGFLKRNEGCELAFASIVEGDIGDKAGRVRAAIDAWIKRLAAL